MAMPTGEKRETSKLQGDLLLLHSLSIIKYISYR